MTLRSSDPDQVSLHRNHLSIKLPNPQIASCHFVRNAESNLSDPITREFCNGLVTSKTIVSTMSDVFALSSEETCLSSLVGCPLRTAVFRKEIVDEYCLSCCDYTVGLAPESGSRNNATKKVLGLVSRSRRRKTFQCLAASLWASALAPL